MGPGPRSVTQLEAMKKDQYILAITGLLDQESAALVLREVNVLIRTGYHRVTLDARDLGPALPEGVLALRRGMAELALDIESGKESRSGQTGSAISSQSHSAEEIYIDCVHLSERASVQFLLHAVPVADHRAVLYPESNSSETPSRPAEYDASAAADDPGAVPQARTRLRTPPVAPVGASGWIVDCPNCHHPSRVRSAGEYACPVCGVAFRMDPAGEILAL